MGVVVFLDPYRRSQSDTQRALASLAAEARPGGRLIGIAFVAMYRGLEYDVGAAGETRKSPTFARGMLCLLDDELSKLIREP